MNGEGQTSGRFERRKRPRVALRMALVYAVAAVLWIVLTDAFARALSPSAVVYQVLSTAKGFLFVVVTAAILYSTVRAYIRQVEAGEDTARDAAERQALIVDTVPSGILVTDVDGRITFVNDIAARILRAPKEEITSRAVEEATWRIETADGLPLPTDRLTFTRVIATGEPIYDVLQAVAHPDGSRTLVSVSAAPMRDADGAIASVLTVIEDVSEEHEAEQRIVHLNRIHSMLSQINKAIIRISDVPELYAEACRITVEYGQFRMAWVGLVDEQTGAILPAAYSGADAGYLDSIHITARDEDAGRGPVGTAARLGRAAISNDVAHDPYMRPWAKAALERGFKALAAFPLKDGDRVYGTFAIYAGEPGFFDAAETRLLEDLTADIAFGVAHIRQDAELSQLAGALSEEMEAKSAVVDRLSEDIAKRTEVEGHLREANDALDAVIESSPLPIIAMDLEGRVTIWNSAAGQVFGWRNDEVLGRRNPIVPPEEQAELDEMLGVLRSGGRVDDRVVRRRKRDGSSIEVSVHAAPIRSADGRVDMSVAVLRDVTERSQLEQLKSDFISAVSHELRTPLTTIIGYSDMLARAETGGVAETPAEMAEKIHAKAVELQGHIDQLLEAASLQAGATRLSTVRTDVGELVREAAEKAYVPEGHTLEVTVAPDLPPAVLDRARIGQVVDSLLSNAVKYSPGGGPIRIDLSEASGRLLLRVSDEGIGIPAEELDTVFDRFTQVDGSSTRSFGGLGLGLYVARRVVEAHGGRITAESTPGKGSTFTVELPLSEA